MKTCFCSSLLACALFWAPQSELFAAPPEVEVDFLMDPLPVTLGLDDPNSGLALAIAADLRTEAVELLNQEFPFLQWVPPPAPGGDPIARLKFTMRAEPGIGQRVFIDSSVTNRVGVESPLRIVARDVYPAGVHFPTPSEVEPTTLANAKSTLYELIHGKSDQWQEKLTRKIPIGHRLVHPRPTDTFFILPLPVSRLRANRESILRAEFRAKVGNNSLQQDGEIELRPLQPVYEPDDQFYGMQICEVEYYRYHPIEADRFHPNIPLALANQVPSTRLRVFMKKYVAKEEDPIDDEF